MQHSSEAKMFMAMKRSLTKRLLLSLPPIILATLSLLAASSYAQSREELLRLQRALEARRVAIGCARAPVTPAGSAIVYTTSRTSSRSSKARLKTRSAKINTAKLRASNTRNSSLDHIARHEAQKHEGERQIPETSKAQLKPVEVGLEDQGSTPIR